jgi:hypothetical protein
MPVIIKNKNLRWDKAIPYAVDPKFSKDKKKLRKLIADFNAKIGKDVFIPYDEMSHVYYVLIMEGADSSIGCELKDQGYQELRVRIDSTARIPRSPKTGPANLYHEMGHCCGLGHTYFHSGCNFPKVLAEDGINKLIYDGNKPKYENFGQAYVESCMHYTPSAFVNNEEKHLTYICEQCNGNYRRIDILINWLSGQSGEIYPEILAKAKLLKEYWTFDAGFMMKISDADKAAILKVLGY